MVYAKVLNVYAIKVILWIQPENSVFQRVALIVVKVIVLHPMSVLVTMVLKRVLMAIVCQNALEVVTLVSVQHQTYAHVVRDINCNKINAFQYANGRDFHISTIYLFKTIDKCYKIFPEVAYMDAVLHQIDANVNLVGHWMHLPFDARLNAINHA